MSPASRRAAIASEWARASEALDEAEILHAATRPVGAVSRAYYAAFHAAQALLFSLGLQPRTHQGTRSLIGLHLVSTGRLAPQHGRALSYAATDREDADYDPASVFTQDDARRAIERAQDFIAAAEVLLREGGWLDDGAP